MKKNEVPIIKGDVLFSSETIHQRWHGHRSTLGTVDGNDIVIGEEKVVRLKKFYTYTHRAEFVFKKRTQ